MSKKSCFTAFIDATGSLLNNEGRRTLIYSLCGFVPFRSVKCLPLLEWFSASHDGLSIAVVIEEWLKASSGLLKKPDIIVCDFSWALLFAVSKAFNNKSIEEQLNAQWEMLQGRQCDLTVVRLCANHLIHMLKRRLTALNSSRKVCIIKQGCAQLID